MTENNSYNQKRLIISSWTEFPSAFKWQHVFPLTGSYSQEARDKEVLATGEWQAGKLKDAACQPPRGLPSDPNALQLATKFLLGLSWGLQKCFNSLATLSREKQWGNPEGVGSYFKLWVCVSFYATRWSEQKKAPSGMKIYFFKKPPLQSLKVPPVSSPFESSSTTF